MIDEQTTENNQLQLNLALDVLEQFMNLKVRISIDTICLDLWRSFGDVKLAVEKFERSPERDVCPYLSELIKKVVFYYELVFQFVKSRSLPEKIISTYFPDTPRSIIHGAYDSTIVVKSCLEEAEKLIDELYDILNKPVDLSTLHNVEKFTTLPKPRKQPKYNASGDKFVVGIIAVLFGAFGIHKFILGYNKEGLILLGISSILLTFGHSTGFISIIGIVEGIIYMSKSTQDFAKIYVSGKREWF